MINLHYNIVKRGSVEQLISEVHNKKHEAAVVSNDHYIKYAAHMHLCVCAFVRVGEIYINDSGQKRFGKHLGSYET